MLAFSAFFFQMDLGTFINKSGCECLNESDDHHLSAALAKGPDYLESDCDEQVHVQLYIHKIINNALPCCKKILTLHDINSFSQSPVKFL